MVLGLVITIIGIVLIPAPGPGWPVVALGMATLTVGGALWLARRRMD
jgi:Putative transmembrane protein (PGPGW)